jgi:transposase, IS5 family
VAQFIGARRRSRAYDGICARLSQAVQHYRELIKLTRATLATVDQAATQVWQALEPIALALWQAEFRRYPPLIKWIIAQAECRLLHGEAVRLREARQPVRAARRHHRQRQTRGSVRPCTTTTSRSGLILDLVIEAGNPADRERFSPMLQRDIAFYFYWRGARAAAADGGFPSRDNLAEAKAQDCLTHASRWSGRIRSQRALARRVGHGYPVGCLSRTPSKAFSKSYPTDGTPTVRTREAN